MTTEALQDKQEGISVDYLCSKLDGGLVDESGMPCGPAEVERILEGLSDEQLFATSLTSEQYDFAMDGVEHWADLSFMIGNAKSTRLRITGFIDTIYAKSESTPLTHEEIDVLLQDAISQGSLTSGEASIVATRLGLFSKE